MKAKEMFLNLGYKINDRKNLDYIEYIKPYASFFLVISFNNASKTIMCATYNKGSWHSQGMAFTLDELNAINKQVEELGW